MKSRPLLHLLLALLLLISQQIGFAHLLSHGLAGQAAKINPTLREAQHNPTSSQPGKALLDQACAECLFLTHLGLALSGRLPVYAFGLLSTPAVSSVVFDAPALLSPSPYLSRAPPF